MITLSEQSLQRIPRNRVNCLISWKNLEVSHKVKKHRVQRFRSNMAGDTHTATHTKGELMTVR